MTAPATEATAVVLNLPLAEAVLEQITKHPETHKQAEHWGFRSECGTTLCIAGQALALTPDVTFVWRPWRDRGEDLHAVLLPGFMDPWDPEDAAREALGLDLETAEHLFYGLTEDESVAYLRELIAAAKQVTA